MNTLGITLVWAAIQVAFVASAGLGLSGWLARRSPRTASRLTTLALNLILILTLLLFCPLPGWNISAVSHERPLPSPMSMTNGDIPPKSREMAAVDHPEISSSTLPSSTGMRMVWQAMWNSLARAERASAMDSASWTGWVGSIFLVGVVITLGRMLLGLWSVHCLRRQSRRIDDPELTLLTKELQAALGCMRVIGIHESDDLNSPATVGWREPLILLPHDWPNWSSDERRSILAHELAHISRGDYLAGLLARFAEAVHFYHPLIHWLGCRLRMQQELAADALGAQHAGGPGNYLKVLARMALRQEGSTHGWLARAFLPAGGTLMRRIQMLRMHEGRLNRSWTGSAAIMALLVVAVSVAGLRSPAQEKSSVPQATRTASQAPPLDLRYAPPEGVGLLAMRPAALLATPELKSLCQYIDTAAGGMLNAVGWTAKAPSVADIDQVTLGIMIREDRNNPVGQQRAMLMNPTMIRLVRPFDWLTYIRAGDKKFQRAEYAGYVYYKADPDNKGFLGQGLCYYIPDDRTLVMESETNLKKMLDRPAGVLPDYVSAKGWKHMEHGLAVVAFGNWEKSWTDNIPTDEDPELAVLAGMQHASHYVGGVQTSSTHVILDGIFDVAQPEHAKELAENLTTLFGSDRLSSKMTSEKPRTPDEEVIYQFLKGLEKGTKVITGKDGRGVIWHTEAEGSLIELGKILAREIAGK